MNPQKKKKNEYMISIIVREPKKNKNSPLNAK